MATITIKQGGFLLQELKLGFGTLTIGRAKDNDIHLEDHAASAHHAKILNMMNAFHIEDLDSTNGTYLNGKRIKEHTLHHRDIITIGNHQILFKNVQVNQNEQKTMVLSEQQLNELLEKDAKFQVPQQDSPDLQSSAHPTPTTKQVQHVPGNTVDTPRPHAPRVTPGAGSQAKIQSTIEKEQSRGGVNIANSGHNAVRPQAKPEAGSRQNSQAETKQSAPNEQSPAQKNISERRSGARSSRLDPTVPKDRASTAAPTTKPGKPRLFNWGLLLLLLLAVILIGYSLFFR